MPFRTRGMRGIFDQREPMMGRELEDRLHTAGMAAVMHDDECARPRADRSFDVVRIDIEVVFPVDIAEDGIGPGMPDRVGSSDEIE